MALHLFTILKNFFQYNLIYRRLLSLEIYNLRSSFYFPFSFCGCFHSKLRNAQASTGGKMEMVLVAGKVACAIPS